MKHISEEPFSEEEEIMSRWDLSLCPFGYEEANNRSATTTAPCAESNAGDGLKKIPQMEKWKTLKGLYNEAVVVVQVVEQRHSVRTCRV